MPWTLMKDIGIVQLGPILVLYSNQSANIKSHHKFVNRITVTIALQI